MVKLLKITWVFLCVLVLVTAFRLADPFVDGEVFIAAVLAMIMLSFPASYVMSFLLGTAALLERELSPVLDSGYWRDLVEPYDIYRNYFSLLFVWALFFIAGYLQWFKLAPWLILRLIAKFRSYFTPNKNRRLAGQNAE